MLRRCRLCSLMAFALILVGCQNTRTGAYEYHINLVQFDSQNHNQKARFGIYLDRVSPASNGDIFVSGKLDRNPMGYENAQKGAYILLRVGAGGKIKWFRVVEKNEPGSGLEMLPLPDGGVLWGKICLDKDGNFRWAASFSGADTAGENLILMPQGGGHFKRTALYTMDISRGLVSGVRVLLLDSLFLLRGALAFRRYTTEYGYRSWYGWGYDSSKTDSLLLLPYSYPEGQIVWAKTVLFHGERPDRRKRVNLLSAGDVTYLSIGDKVYEWESNNEELHLALMDKVGKLRWAKKVGFAGFKVDRMCFVNSKTKGMVGIGSTPLGAGGEDMVVFEIDTLGNLAWIKRFGGSSKDVATDATQLPDGRIVVVGYSSSFKLDWDWDSSTHGVILILDEYGNTKTSKDLFSDLKGSVNFKQEDWNVEVKDPGVTPPSPLFTEASLDSIGTLDLLSPSISDFILNKDKRKEIGFRKLK